MYVGHDVLAVDDELCLARQAQRDVQDGAVLADVDVLAAEHGRDPLAQPRPLGQGREQAEGLVGRAVLGVVEVEVAGGHRHAAGSARVLREQLAQLPTGQLFLVLAQGRPLRGLGDVAVHVFPPRVAKPIMPGPIVP